MIKKIAHRGLFNNKEIPENSIISFIKAKENNLSIELDIRMTKDEEIVVFHDINIERMCGINKDLSSLTFSELKKYTLLNTNYKIEKLSKILNLINVDIYIEIKEIKNQNINVYIEKIAKIIKNYNNIYIISFNPYYLRKIKKINNNIKIGQSLENNKPFSFKIIKLFFSKISKPDFYVCEKTALSKMNKKDKIITWTIMNKEEEIEALKYTNKIIIEDKNLLEVNHNV